MFQWRIRRYTTDVMRTRLHDEICTITKKEEQRFGFLNNSCYLCK